MQNTHFLSSMRVIDVNLRLSFLSFFLWHGFEWIYANQKKNIKTRARKQARVVIQMCSMTLSFKEKINSTSEARVTVMEVTR